MRREWAKELDSGIRLDLRTPTLGEIQVVLHQRVLGVVAASNHAAPAQVAPRSGWTLPSEIRIRDLNVFFSKEDTDLCRSERGPDSHAL